MPHQWRYTACTNKQKKEEEISEQLNINIS